MAYKPDPRLVRKMTQKLAMIFGCSYGDVAEFKQDLLLGILEDHPSLREDVAEYRLIMLLAKDHNDPGLAELMHLYSVGYFIEDTKNYKPKSGEEYEIINNNYLSSYDFLSDGENKI